jgi:hypothetical protein
MPSTCPKERRKTKREETELAIRAALAARGWGGTVLTITAEKVLYSGIHVTFNRIFYRERGSVTFLKYVLFKKKLRNDFKSYYAASNGFLFILW